MDSAGQHLTVRCVFCRDALAAIAQEKEFEGNISLTANLSVEPSGDHFLAVFVFFAEPGRDGDRLLRILSTTVLGIQRYTTKRLRSQGIHIVDDPDLDGFLIETLRAHFRAEERLMMDRLGSISTAIPMRWSARYSNGGGDIETEPFVIADPDLEDIKRIFALSDERPEFENGEPTGE